MKRFKFSVLAVAVFCCTAVWGQSVSIGDRISDLKIKEWSGAKPSPGKYILLEFFHSSSKASVDNLARLSEMAQKWGSKLSVVVVVKEGKECVAKLFSPSHSYSVGYDEGRLFESLGVNYIPFSVLVDTKGRVVWYGSSADDKTLRDHVE